MYKWFEIKVYAASNPFKVIWSLSNQNMEIEIKGIRDS